MSSLIVTNCGRLITPIGVLDITTTNIGYVNEGDGRVTLQPIPGVTLQYKGDGILQIRRVSRTCAPTTTTTTTTTTAAP